MDIERAGEIKVAVVAIQNHAKGKCPFLVFSGKSQSIKISYKFNKHVTRICIDIYKDQEIIELASVEADSSGCDISFIKSELCDFLLGKSFHISLVDINHNRKLPLPVPGWFICHDDGASCR